MSKIIYICVFVVKQIEIAFKSQGVRFELFLKICAVFSGLNFGKITGARLQESIVWSKFNEFK